MKPSDLEDQEAVEVRSRRWFRPLPDLYYGWVVISVLGITTVISYGTTQYLFGVLVVPLAQTFSWSRSTISGANTLNLLIAGGLGVPIGYLVDRYGPRLLMTLGSLLAGGTLLGLAFLQQIWQFYFLWAGGVGVATALLLYPVTFTVVACWFEQKRARALALLTLLGGLASPIFIPLAGWLIPQIGWRPTLLSFGLLHLCVATPLHVGLLRRSPEALGLAPDGMGSIPVRREEPLFLPGLSVQQALSRGMFWLLSASFALAMLGSQVLFTHQVAHLINRGYNAVFAAALAGGLGLASLPGRFFLNLLAERISPQKLLAICLLLQALGVIVLILAPSAGWLIVYVLLYGAAYGAFSPLRAAVMAEHYGRRAYGAITAVQGIPIALCAACGPLVAGWLYDLTGRYDVPFWLITLGFGLATLGVWFTPIPGHEHF